MWIRSLVCAAIVFGIAIKAQTSSPVRVQLTTGGHDHEISFYRIFDDMKELHINVNPHPGAYRGDLRRRYDVLVLYDMVDTDDERERRVLRDFLESGRGLVIMHHAIVSNQQWPWWSEEVAGGLYYQNARDGKPKSTFRHDIEMDVRPVAKHPILNGIGAFRIHDEGYKGMFLSPKSKPLLEVDHADSDKVVAWIGPHEKSRVVVIQLGHGRESHEHPLYRRLVKNAIMWAAGREVSSK